MSFADNLTRFIVDLVSSHQDNMTVAPEDDLLLSGVLDSIGVMSLVLHIETELGIPVPPEDVTIENFVSIRAIDTYLSKRVVEDA